MVSVEESRMQRTRQVAGSFSSAVFFHVTCWSARLPASPLCMCAAGTENDRPDAAVDSERSDVCDRVDATNQSTQMHTSRSAAASGIMIRTHQKGVGPRAWYSAAAVHRGRRFFGNAIFKIKPHFEEFYLKSHVYAAVSRSRTLRWLRGIIFANAYAISHADPTIGVVYMTAKPQTFTHTAKYVTGRFSMFPQNDILYMWVRVITF